MSIADLIRKRETGKPANANPANPAKAAKAAKDGQAKGKPLARLATLALANLPESASSSPADERIEKMIAKLETDPGLRYAMETHAEIDLEAVILTLAIRGKGACELRIPKSRCDAFALLELIEKHTMREILQ